MKRSTACTLLLAALALQTANSHAAILVDNTDNLTATTSTTGTFSFGQGTPNSSYFGWTVEIGGTGFDATSASIPLYFNASTGIPSPTFRVRVWELSSLTDTRPSNGSASIFTQDYPSISLTDSAVYYTFSFTNTLSLTASTRYSIGFATDGGGTDASGIIWAKSDSSFTPGTPATATGTFGSADGGNNFYEVPLNVGFQLTGDAAAPVPEPSTWALALAGVTCSAWGMARRRRAAGRVRSV